MIIFPAVDIQNGKCVRLRRGVASESTVFSDAPVDMALHWQKQGAKWLHLIDLDGAFEGEPVNIKLVEKICHALSIPVQVGGGVRDMNTARHYMEAGVERIIIGTLALRDPKAYADICAAFPGRVGISLDAENGKLKTKGWVEDSGLTVTDVLERLHNDGTAFIVYTDIARDGMQSGVNLETMAELSRNSRIPVIAAGGVSSLEDIKQLYPLTPKGALHGSLQGAISGRAIYEGTLNLAEAMHWVEEQSA